MEIKGPARQASAQEISLWAQEAERVHRRFGTTARIAFDRRRFLCGFCLGWSAAIIANTLFVLWQTGQLF